MHTSRSGSEMWKQRLCTGNTAEGAREQAGNGSRVWAALGSSGRDEAADLGDGALALPLLWDQAQALQGEAGMSLAGACWLWMRPGDSSGQWTWGLRGLQRSKQPWQRGTKHRGGEGKPARGFMLSSGLEKTCQH